MYYRYQRRSTIRLAVAQCRRHQHPRLNVIAAPPIEASLRPAADPALAIAHRLLSWLDRRVPRLLGTTVAAAPPSDQPELRRRCARAAAKPAGTDNDDADEFIGHATAFPNAVACDLGGFVLQTNTKRHYEAQLRPKRLMPAGPSLPADTSLSLSNIKRAAAHRPTGPYHLAVDTYGGQGWPQTWALAGRGTGRCRRRHQMLQCYPASRHHRGFIRQVQDCQRQDGRYAKIVHRPALPRPAAA